MGGVRNGKSAGTPEPAAARQDALRAGAPDVRPEEAARDTVDRHLRSALDMLREGSAARAFGQLARASHTEPMTPRLAAALVRFALLAGTEAAAITLLDATPGQTPDVRRAVQRQLARVLRRVGQVPRAIAALEAVLAERPDDRRARRGLQVLRERERRGGTEAQPATAGGPAASGVLGKLPTLKSGVQAPAVWDEGSSSYREDTLLESASSASRKVVPREKTAVAFPTAAPAEPREKTAVAFPAASPPVPHVPWSTPGRMPDASQAESRTKTEVEMPAVVGAANPPVPESRPTVVEMPAVGVASEEPTSPARPTAGAASNEPASKARSTAGELPAVSAASRETAFESRPTLVEMPAIVVPSGVPSSESRKPAEEPPRVGESVNPTAPSQPAGGSPHLSVPWAESPSELEERPPARDVRAQVPRANPWADDEPTSELTFEAPPVLPNDAARGAPPEAKPSEKGTPRTAEASPERVERTQAPATSAPEKHAAVPAASPAETQEVSMADLEAALSGQATPPAASAAAAQGASAAATGRARTDGADTQASGAARAATPGPRAEDSEELARSQKLEAQLIARQAWRELAQLYLKRADRAKDAAVRAEALTRLAEVMENELQDPSGAARMYREIVELTGDRTALREQVRLLSTRGDASLVRRALDEAIQRARTARARAGALLTRGERWLHMGEPGRARSDFEAAEALAPGMLPVLAGLLRCVANAERPAIAERLRLALATAPRRALDRLEGLRMLAQAAEESLGDLRLAQWAWTEVLAESPDSEHARGQLVALARKLGDSKTLGEHLRAQLARESRGPAARQARLELVDTLDAQGDDEAALNELRQAVRYEPGHKEAWLLLVDRLTARGNMGEAAWALEHAATATEDEAEREQAWERLARLWREVLRNPERAQVYARRAEGLRQAREERELPPPEPPRSATPRREPSGPKSPLVPAPATLSLTPSGIEALANEITSNTDVIVPPSAAEAPAASKKEAGAKGRGGDVAPASSDGASPGSSARSRKRAEKASASPAGKAAQSKDKDASASRAERSAAATGASAAPSAAGVASPRVERTSPPGASPARSEPRAPASGGASPASASPSARAEQRAPASGGAAPVAAAPSARAEQRSAPVSAASPPGAPAAPSGRPEQRSTAPAAGPAPTAPPSRDPAPKSRNPAARADKAAPPPPPRAPMLGDDEPIAPTRALGFNARSAPRPGSADTEPPARAAKATDLMGDEESMELGSEDPVANTRVISWEAPPGRMDPVRRIVRARGEGTVSAPAPARPAAAKPPEPAARVGPGASETREAPAVSEPSPDTEPNFFRHLRERPLDPKPYRESAEYFDSRGDAGRALLMREIADALEGREPPASPPRPQRAPLTSEERAGLRHPGLRTPSGELLACTGIALCRLFPAQGRAAGTTEPLRAASGPGAPAVLDALHTAARLLDVHLPELVLAEDEGPPFTAVHVGQPRLLVGRLTIQQPPSAAELRFHAGRALLSLSPDLLALRALKGGQLLRALALLSTILKDPRASSSDARVVRESLSPRALERAVALLDVGTRDFNASSLADAARDSANRAGLVACGSVGPALAVLRARHNPDAELVELLRFAASERYLELRAPR
jgi:thioredoxin-like negative regulator of GroEL